MKGDVAAQKKLALFIRDTYRQYSELNEKRNRDMLKIYNAFSTFEERRKAAWQTVFKVNKSHEIIEKVLPRLIAKDPRWIVEPKVEDFFADKELPEIQEGVPPEMMQEQVKARKDEIKKRQELRNDYAKAIQAYLSYLFDEYNFSKDLRMFAKTMCVYGKARAKIGYKYEIVRNFTEPKYDKEGNEVEKPKIEEDVVGEHPFIDVKSWTETLVDPRYRDMRDIPALLEVTNKVRIADLYRKKDEYLNLDQVKDVANIDREDVHVDDLRRQVLALAAVNWIEEVMPDKNSVTLLTFYGFYNEDDNKPEDEKLIQATVIKETGIVIEYKEITRIPFVEASCFEDTETGNAVGFVEPMMKLQDELNFKKNSASEFINQSLNRSWIWSPQSGVDPRDLVSRPGNIIVTDKTGPEAQANCVELPMRQVPSDFFQEQLDIERQIQGQTFTVDTSNPKGEQALTNTATGMRIKFFESNSVLDEVRKHFEKALEELAYQLLQETFERMDDNIVLKKMDADEYWEIHKEALRDAVKRYTIKVEVNSSSFDDIENRRSDAMAFFNMLMQASQSGVQVDMEKAVVELLQTFEKRNPYDYLLPPDMSALAQQMPGGGQPGGAPLPEEEMPPQPGGMSPAELTEQVAQGQVLQASPNYRP